MAIDENGTTDLKGIKRIVNKYLSEDEIIPSNYEHQWFTISGVVMDRKDFPDFRNKITNIKYSYWEQGKFRYKKTTKRVVFHSREIRKKEGPFNPNIINYSAFMNDLSSMINDIPFRIYSSSIDKIQHVIQYVTPYNPYSLCLTFIVERYCRYLRARNKNGILLLESRGKKEDHQILSHLVEFLERGNKYWSQDKLSCIHGVYFNPKWHSKQASFINLELADLVSYPIHKYVKRNVQDKAYQIIQPKIYGYPSINGYGLKIFP